MGVATLVRGGVSERFDRVLRQRATRFYVRVGGRCGTGRADLDGVEVTHFAFSGTDPALRQVELLRLRAAFLGWWESQWAQTEGPE